MRLSLIFTNSHSGTVYTLKSSHQGVDNPHLFVLSHQIIFGIFAFFPCSPLDVAASVFKGISYTLYKVQLDKYISFKQSFVILKSSDKHSMVCG